MSEPSTAAVTEVEPDSESSMAQQPASGAEPESSESRTEEVRSLGRLWVFFFVFYFLGSWLYLPLTCILTHVKACFMSNAGGGSLKTNLALKFDQT